MNLKDTPQNLVDDTLSVMSEWSRKGEELGEAKEMPDPFGNKNRAANDKNSTKLLKANKMLVEIERDIVKGKFVPLQSFLDYLEGLQGTINDISLESDMAQSQSGMRDY